MLPIEFTFQGPPLSLQSKNKTRKRAYKQKVEAAARATLPNGFGVVMDQVNIQITYYHEGDTPDVDNIIKPIQDALIGVVYQDDQQIMDTRSRKCDINSTYKLRRASACLLQAFSVGDDFIHVKIERHIPSQDLS